MVCVRPFVAKHEYVATFDPVRWHHVGWPIRVVDGHQV
jgi:hypothetical protein